VEEAAVGAAAASVPAEPARARSGIGGDVDRSYAEVAPPELPLALADLHRTIEVGARIRLGLLAGPVATGWSPPRLTDVVLGAGFTVDRIDATAPEDDGSPIDVAATRARTLPDTVGPGMRLLVCGLNPSVLSADVGIGFARTGNRYWPAALAAGIVSVDRDTRHALVRHRIGMTDLVKRATPRADELTTAEYRAGLDRVSRLCAWLRPGAVCFVGLAGWRAAADRKAVAGVQPEPLGDTPVYVMPSTSGLNARTTPAELADHLRAAAALADAHRPDPNR
jgi:TDG/mug DNA glycosylase family protein